MATQPTDDHKAVVTEHLQSNKVSTMLMNLFDTLFVPILASVLAQYGPKLASKPKVLKSLQEAYKVLGALPGVAPDDE